jgi:2-haloacid dehalogenase
MSVKHVVFDIGRVLVHWDPEIPYLKLIEDDAERARFLAEVCSPAWNLEQDRGRSWEDAEAELVARYPEHEDLIRAFRRQWWDMVPYAYDDSVALFRALIAKGVDVTMLTNWAPDTFAEAEKVFDFLGEARGVTVSGRVGLVKPDRAIFEHHAERFGLDPSETLFIDDSEKNVRGAIAAGWQAVLFIDAEQLRADLKAYGLPV